MDILSQIIFLPVAVSVLMLLMPRNWDRAFYYLGVLTSIIVFGGTLHLFAGFNPTAEFQYKEAASWIHAYGVTYLVGIDGISLVLILLTSFLTTIALVSSLTAIKKKRKEFVIAILFLESAMIGTFAAMDAFLFYVFWEAMLIPMYFLIGIFGGERRIYATLKFFIYTMAGSVLMLVGLITVYVLHTQQFGFASTAFVDLYQVATPFAVQAWLFALFAVAFAIKVPMFPFHTWLPDAHVEAPTAGSVILAGVLLKMGGYGLIRLAFPLFPAATAAMAPTLAVLAVIGIVYGAYVALAQEDMKKLVAYSSVSHMGFVILGLASLNPKAMTGAVFQMIAHGLSTGALFLLVGMLYERRHTRLMTDYGGIAKVAPRLTTMFLIVTLASVGLPGLSGFVGEFLILTGSFQALVLKHPAWLVAFATLGIVLGAAYMFLLVERVFWGKVKFEENEKLLDLNAREMTTILVPVILMIVFGLKPGFLLRKIEPSILSLTQRIEKEAGYQVADTDRSSQEELSSRLTRRNF